MFYLLLFIIYIITYLFIKFQSINYYYLLLLINNY